jgi:hypothetical protein
VNTRRTSRTCFQRGKPGHFATNCSEKTENKDDYKDGYKHRLNKDGKYRSRRDHKHKNKHKDEQRSRKKEGPSDGRSERCRLQLRLVFLELE